MQVSGVRRIKARTNSCKPDDWLNIGQRVLEESEVLADGKTFVSPFIRLMLCMTRHEENAVRHTKIPSEEESTMSRRRQETKE